MATETACRWCGVHDALGRHAGDCQHAIDVGLPRLADGEEPIADFDEDIESDQSTDDYDAAPPPAPKSTYRQPIEELWLAYTNSADGFDAVVFASELEALRYAVKESCHVAPLKLGRPLRQQAKEAR